MPNKPSLLSIIVPCYQERHRLQACIDGLQRAVQAAALPTEIIVVDDGSTDGTATYAEELLAPLKPPSKVLRTAHQGKGSALQNGVSASRGDFVFLADADWSMPPEQIQRFLPPNAEDFSIAIANREHPESKRINEPFYRHILGRGFNAFVQRMLLSGIEDSQCGYKCLDGDFARTVFPKLQCKGWAFDVELLFLARQSQATILEVPIDWNFDSDSRIRPLRDAFQMARDVAAIRRRHLH